jgi:hypothetical protein
MQRHGTPEELAEQWTLFPRERVLLAHKSGPTRLGCAVLLKYFQCEARFRVYPPEVPSAIVAYLAQQVGVAAEVWPQYNWNGRAIKYHRAQIRPHRGFREATSADGHALRTWLGEQILATTHRLEYLREAVYQRCRDLQIEPPTSDRIDRLINAAVQTFEARLCDHVLKRLSLTTRQQLEALLEPIETPVSDPNEAAPFGAGRTLLHELRAEPGRATLDNLFREIVKLAHVRALALPLDLVDAVSPNVLQTYGQRAAVEAPYELRRHPEPLRMTLLAVFAHLRSRELTDTLVDLFLELVHRIGARAERKVEKELLEDLKRVHGKTGMLYRLAEATLDHPNDVVKEVVFPVVSEATLRDLVKEWKSTGPLYL